MRKLLIIGLCTIGIIGCSLDDDNQSFAIDLVPILEADIPEELKKDSIYDLTLRYLRPTDCHSFRGIDYNYNDKERIVAILNTVLNNENCKKLENDTVSVDLKLRVAQDDLYIFKFWQGKDDEGENIFLTKEIPVISGQ